MMEEYISTGMVSQLTGEAPQRIREKAANGTYIIQRQRSALGGGNSGESYQIAVSSLPAEAQIRYLLRTGALGGQGAEADLTAYREKYGEAGIQELLARQRAAEAGIAIRRLQKKGCVEQLKGLAAEQGTTVRSLYRWMDGYESQGLAGLMRTVVRKDTGRWRSICPAAYAYAYGLYMTQVKRKKTVVHQMVLERARKLGPEACGDCMYREGSAARAALEAQGEVNHYPPCPFPTGAGLLVPECRQTMDRILGAIPKDELTLARRGKKALKDDCMPMAIRAKPEQVNEVWFGDHHQMDCFVLDEEGKAVRPWLTMWYDAASGFPVGWVLCKKPNTQTIIAAFNNAVLYKKASPSHGLPRMVYVDNGKDYRGKLFETGYQTEVSLGRLNESIDTCSVLQLLHIEVTHALPYQGWSKPVERFFGTIENLYIREAPGWCGDSPEERPEDFSRQLRLMTERGQLWTMDQLFEYLRDTVFPGYWSRPHEGYGGRTPLELYESLPRAREDEPSAELLGVLKNKKQTRKIGQQGVRLNNEIYWDDAMIGHAGEEVTVLYDEEDLSTITVILKGRTLCEASVHERMQMVGEDPEVVAAHQAKQKGYVKGVAERIKRASRYQFALEVDEKRSRGTYTTLEYEKAARGRKAKRAELAEPKDEGPDLMREKLRASGDMVLRRLHERQ